MNQEQADRIERELVEIKAMLSKLVPDGSNRLPSEIKREARAKVLQLSARRSKKRGNVGAHDRSE